MMLNEIWLRPGQPGATAFSLFFDTTNGDGALFKAEISPSQQVPAMINKFPGELIVWGLRGRGIIETEDGATVTVGAAASCRVPGNTPFKWRNELRETWGVLCFLPDGGAAAFLDSLPQCTDDSEMLDEAAAYGLSLHLPPPEPEIPAAIRALENRIAYPMNASFSL